jgi:hypothetical protein
MNKRGRYVFGAALAGVALGGIGAFDKKAHAAILTTAAFTFETPNAIFPSTGTSSTSNTSASGTFFLFGSQTTSSVGPLLADSGTGSAYGMHFFTASSGNTSPNSTVWSTPVGNGSQRSLSANHWGAGDLYEFDVSTQGIAGILISFDQTSSGTGPKAFSLQYSVGATSGTAGSYLVGTTSFGAGSSSTAVSFGFDLSAVTALDNQSLVKFSLVDTDTTTATGGTDRIDNFVVSGTAIPEPASLSLLTVAAAAAMYRRREDKTA